MQSTVLVVCFDQSLITFRILSMMIIGSGDFELIDDLKSSHDVFHEVQNSLLPI